MEYRDHQFEQNWIKAFNAWERSCRGWDLWDIAVALEPPFKRIVAPTIRQGTQGDDARTAGGLRGFIGRNHPHPAIQISPHELLPSPESAIKPSSYYRNNPISELQLRLPRDLDVSPNMAEQMLLSLGNFNEPIAFEIYGDAGAASCQIACPQTFASTLSAQWKAVVSGIGFTARDGFLKQRFERSLPEVIVDFALSRNFVLPLRGFRSFSPDPLGGVIGSLESLTSEDRTAFQVMFIPTRSPWSDVLLSIQTDPDQKRMLTEVDASCVAAIREKLATPLFAVTIRLMVQSSTAQRAWTLARQIGGSLRQFGQPGGNELIAVDSRGYPANNHHLSFFARTNYRSGFLLNTTELVSLIHPPSSSVCSEKFERLTNRTRPTPGIVIGHDLLLGENHHESGVRYPSLSEAQRTRHIHIIGSTGSGKSTLLLNMIRQDMETGKGLCLLDPAGDLVDAVCAAVPESRVEDIVLFDASDVEHPIACNILEAHSDQERTLIESDFTAAFRRMSTTWGDQMSAVLANSVLAILESDRGGTLIDLRRFLVEDGFRTEWLESVKDDAVRYFWTNEFPLVAGKPQASILIRLGELVRQRIIRNIVGQKESRIDFRSLMDNRKILLIKLAQGLIGIENAQLLGSLLLSKLHQAALSRQSASDRPFFGVYIDEFHNLIVPSLEAVLSGIRQYNIGLTLSHQEFRQLLSRSPEVAASVISNCYTRICFRLGHTDAERFAGEFAHFTSSDLQNLGIGAAIARVERSEYDFNLQTMKPPVIDRSVAAGRRAEIVRICRAKYAVPRNIVEEEFAKSRTEATVSTPLGKSRSVLSGSPTVSATLRGRTADGQVNEHKYLQRIVKRIAEKYGFIATIEKPVLGGTGRIDVALETEDVRVACEIAITNTVSYEVQNIRKCISAGYDCVVVLSLDEEHLADIMSATRETIGSDQMNRVAFVDPENFHLYLEGLSVERKEASGGEKVKGYSVGSSYAEADSTTANLIGQAIEDILLDEVSS